MQQDAKVAKRPENVPFPLKLWWTAASSPEKRQVFLQVISLPCLEITVSAVMERKRA